MIVCHGMGQQVPFETLNGVADVLRDADPDRRLRVNKRTARFATLGEVALPRVELCMEKVELCMEKVGIPSPDVHLYEVYWAPLTEGQITLKETVSFLWDAGVRGLTHFLAPGRFDRWLFGELRDLRDLGKDSLSVNTFARGFFVVAIPLLLSALLTFIAALWAAAESFCTGRSPDWAEAIPQFLSCLLLAGAVVGFLTICAANPTTRYLLFALLVFAAMVTIDGIIVALAVSGLLGRGLSGWPGSSTGWPDGTLLANLTMDLLALLLLLVVGSIGILWPLVRRKYLGFRKRERALRIWERICCRVMVALAMVSLVVTAGLMLFHVTRNPQGPGAAWPHPFWPLVAEPGASGLGALHWVAVPLWALMLAASNKVRVWLLQFLGDVAIYVSSHRVNRFSETRQRIKTAGRQVFCSVYGAQVRTPPSLPTRG